MALQPQSADVTKVRGILCSRVAPLTVCGAQGASKRLAIHAWQTAWDSYALAAAVLGQMDFASAMAHKNIICEIVSGADAEGRRWLLAVLYDELARFVFVMFHVAASPPPFVAGMSGRTVLEN